MENILPLAVAFAAGFAVECANYLITRAALRKNKNASALFPLRTLITAAFLAALYFASKALTDDASACLIAGAVGATAGLAIFTFILINNSKGGGTNG